MSKLKLTDISTTPPDSFDKKKTKEKTAKYVEIIHELQHILYAQSKHSILILFQGMDASGKDGATKKVFSSVNPQGVAVTSFKSPSQEELMHDFLWRIHKEVPQKGMIKIFNRSHYEDVLITRAEKIIDDKTAYERMKQINHFERLLEHNNTKILKFYLHISEEEQQKRFQERIENPLKRWKYNEGDAKTAKKWPEYRKYYEELFENCSDVSWEIVPSDKNWYKEYLIAKKVAKTLEDMKLSFPKINIKTT